MRFVVLILLLAAVGCKPSVQERIQQLEQKTAVEQPNTADVKQLAQAYQDAATEHQGQAIGSEYATKAADLLLNKLKMAPEAAKALLPALTNAAIADTAKARAAGLLAASYGVMRNQHGVDKPETEFMAECRAAIVNNRPYADSALQHQRNAMVDDQMQLVHVEVIPPFVDMLEGYALALDAQSGAKRAELLFEAANALRASGNFARSITYYTQVAANTSDLQKAANSQFMMAFVYENDMNDLPQAKVAYETFLKNFPTNEMADDARIALANLGKTPEELLKEFDKKRK